MLVRILKIIVSGIFLFAVFSAGSQQLLPRKGMLDARISYPQPNQAFGVVVSVTKGTAADNSGLRKGDTVVAINGIALRNEIAYRNFLRSLQPGKVANLQVKQGDKIKSIQVPVSERFTEKYTEADVIYGSAKTPKSYFVRTIVTKPIRSKERVPLIVFVQSLACNSMEIHPDSNRRNGDGRLLAALIEQSGFAVLRTEKPGVGDSQGPDCGSLDFLSEVAAHEAALQEAKQLSFVDTNRIYLFGSSMGSAIAPLLASRHRVAGVIVTGGFTKSWYEHMLEFERRRLVLSGQSAVAASKTVSQFALFYSRYLLQKQTPAAIIQQHPDFREIWYDEDERQFGRPAKFYMQVQEQNFMDAWKKVNVPVLIVYGKYDWIMSEEDQHLIADIVNSRRPGNATLVIRPQMSHDWFVHPSLKDAFNDVNGHFDYAAVTEVMTWLRAQAR